jgi:hypothetical protein
MANLCAAAVPPAARSLVRVRPSRAYSSGVDFTQYVGEEYKRQWQWEEACVGRNQPYWYVLWCSRAATPAMLNGGFLQLGEAPV